MSFLRTPSYGSIENPSINPSASLDEEGLTENQFPQVTFILPSRATGSTDSTKQSIWEQVLEESEQGRRLYDQYKEYSSTAEPKLPRINSTTEYLDDVIFPLLLPCLEDTLLKAIKWNVLWYQKSLYNGIDNLSEALWNKNPRHPSRLGKWISIFDVPVIRLWLLSHPRPLIPLSYLLTNDEAAIIIQSYYRGYLVRREEEVQELRVFWKALQIEREEEERQRRETDEKEMERMLKQAVMKTMPQSELDSIRESEDAHKGAIGYINRVLALAWDKIKEEEEEWEKSMDREHIEPYMLLRRSQFQLDHMTDENYEKYFLNQK